MVLLAPSAIENELAQLPRVSALASELLLRRGAGERLVYATDLALEGVTAPRWNAWLVKTELHGPRSLGTELGKTAIGPCSGPRPRATG